MRQHKEQIKNYIYDTYYIAYASEMYQKIYETKNTHEQAEYIAEFIEKDLESFLKGGNFCKYIKKVYKNGKEILIKNEI